MPQYSIFKDVINRGKRYASSLKAAHVNEASGTVDHDALIDAASAGEPLHLIISPNEISFAHGTGVLLSRLLEGKTDFVAMRSRNDYGGQQRITPRAAFALPAGLDDRRAIFALVGKWLNGINVRQIICVPYFATDLTLAIAARAITGAPLGLWVMDDNCLKHDGISGELMREALDMASARFAISGELKREYQTAFQKPFCVVPPLVSPAMVQTGPVDTVPEADAGLVMIGNLWSPKILKRLSNTIAEAGVQVTWYCDNPDLWNGSVRKEVLKKRGITTISNLPPEEVQAHLESARAVILPSDPGEMGGHETALGDMSLPTRLPFIMAASGTPVVILARPGTAAGNFVERFEIGTVVPYDAKALQEAVKQLSAPEEQRRIRANAARHAANFSFEGAFDFLETTIGNGGRWPDQRYESILAMDDNQYALFVDRPAPRQYAEHFSDVVAVCDRLKGIGFSPDWVLDIGASTAVWSRAVESVFDKSRYVLCDPMFSRYDNVWANPHYELVEAAISDKEGEVTFSVSSDLYGSSLIQVSDVVEVVDEVTVPVRTVDAIAAEKRIEGRGLLKVDVQFAEHLVIDGALRLLAEQTDVVILELTLPRVASNSKTLLEMCVRMDELGYRVYDLAGEWRVPKSGELEQMDVVFTRKSLKGTTQSMDAAT